MKKEEEVRSDQIIIEEKDLGHVGGKVPPTCRLCIDSRVCTCMMHHQTHDVHRPASSSFLARSGLSIIPIDDRTLCAAGSALVCTKRSPLLARRRGGQARHPCVASDYILLVLEEQLN